MAQRRGGRRERSGAAGGGRHARKTAKAPMLMVEARVRTPSIGRTGMTGPVCEWPDQPRPTLRASAVAVPPEHWFTRASDASPSWLGLPTLAGGGSLPRSAGLRCSPSQPPRQTGGSDLCSRHQYASSGHSACFAIRVTQLYRISPDYRQLAGRSPACPKMQLSRAVRAQLCAGVACGPRLASI